MKIQFSRSLSLLASGILLTACGQMPEQPVSAANPHAASAALAAETSRPERVCGGATVTSACSEERTNTQDSKPSATNVADFTVQAPQVKPTEDGKPLTEMDPDTRNVDFGWGSGRYSSSFGAHLVRGKGLTIADVAQLPHFQSLDGKLVLGLLNENNLLTVTPRSSAAIRELHFVKDKAIAVIFEWVSHRSSLADISFIMPNDEVRVVHGPFDIFGTGTSNMSETRPLLQQLVESSPRFSRINNMVLKDSSSSMWQPGFASPKEGRTTVVGGGGALNTGGPENPWNTGLAEHSHERILN